MTHETAIAARMIEEAEKHGNVTGIKLALGELGHVPPTELAECVIRLRPDWDVQWEETLAQCKCEACGFVGHPTVLERGHDFFMVECPNCGGMPAITAGTEAMIVNVVVD